MVRADRRPARDEITPSPLLVLTPTGRTGTTLLMALLASHPQIVLESAYPYETRLVQREAMARLDDGCSPPATVPAADHYTRLNRLQQKHAVFFAEKMIGLDLHPIRACQPETRLLATVRDPRDVLLSIRAFDTKRGFRGFALTGEDDLASALLKIRGAFAELIELDRNESELLLVRYEDLLSDQTETLAKLAGWLQIEPFAPVAAPAHPEHRTTEARASVARWRKEMDEHTASLCREYLKNPLSYFNYEL